MGVLQKFWEHLTGKHKHAEPVRAKPQRLRVYLALQRFANGRVMYRRWSPDGDVPGGPFEARTKAPRGVSPFRVETAGSGKG